AGRADASLLRNAFSYSGDQQHVQGHSHGVGSEGMGRRGPRRVLVRAQGTGTDYPSEETQRRRRFGSGLARRYGKAVTAPGPRPVPIASDSEEGRGTATCIPHVAAVTVLPRVRIPSSVVV